MKTTNGTEYYPPSTTIGKWFISPGRPGEDTIVHHNDTGELHAFCDYGKACDWAKYQRNMERIDVHKQADAEQPAQMKPGTRVKIAAGHYLYSDTAGRMYEIIKGGVPGWDGWLTKSTHDEFRLESATLRYAITVINARETTSTDITMTEQFMTILTGWDTIDAAYNEAYGPTNPVLKARWQHKLDYEQARENMAREFIVMAGMLAGKSPATDNALRDSGWEQAQERA